MLLEDMVHFGVEKNDSKGKTPYLEQVTESDTVFSAQEHENSATKHHNVTDFHALRSQYLTLKDSFMGEISRRESEEFYLAIGRAERLHQLVSKPREQVADAEALLEIMNTLLSSLKSSQSPEGVQLSDFICCLIEKYGESEGERDCKLLSWTSMGLDASFICRKALGMHTMIGPMDTKLTQRKAITRGKRVRLSDVCCPEKVENASCKNEKDTNNNVSIMFNILKKKRCIQLEKLVLNRLSFSQTVENMFALTFLVKEGRAEIMVKGSRVHLVSPRNAPRNASTANEIVNKQVNCHQFVLRLDYKDWKVSQLMLECVEKGEEAMPQRDQS